MTMSALLVLLDQMTDHQLTWKRNKQRLTHSGAKMVPHNYD